MRVFVPAVGVNFPCYGISSAYSLDYPIALKGVVSEEDFKSLVSRLNDTLISHWPCDVCYIFGFACIPCSFGLSLLAPAQCAYDVKERAEELLRQHSYMANYYDRKIVFSLHYSFCSSSLMISFPEGLHRDVESQHLLEEQHDEESSQSYTVMGTTKKDT